MKNFTKVLNVFKHNKKIVYDYDYGNPSVNINKYLNSIFDISINNNDFRLLEIILRHIPNLHNNQIVVKSENTLPELIYQKIHEQCVLKQILDKTDIIEYSKKFNGYGKYFRLVYKVLTNNFDDEFIKSYINFMTFPKFCCFVMNNSEYSYFPNDNYVKIFKIMDFKEDKLVRCALWSLFHYYENRHDAFQLFTYIHNLLESKNLLNDNVIKQMKLAHIGRRTFVKNNFNTDDPYFIEI